MQDTTSEGASGGLGSSSRQPLPLFDAIETARTGQAAATTPAPRERDHEDATWYRLVTAISSCYSYVTGHTDLEPVLFVLAPDGTGACYVGSARRWEVALTAAAHRAFPIVVDQWRSGALAACDQVIAIDLGEPVRQADGRWSVDVLPAVAPDARTRTVARR